MRRWPTLQFSAAVPVRKKFCAAFGKSLRQGQCQISVCHFPAHCPDYPAAGRIAGHQRANFSAARRKIKSIRAGMDISNRREREARRAWSLKTYRYNWQGSQIALICFDEVQEFSEQQFWFLFSRNRSMSGAGRESVAPAILIRILGCEVFSHGGLTRTAAFRLQNAAVCCVRFVRDGDSLVWGDSRAELVESLARILSRKARRLFPPASRTIKSC